MAFALDERIKKLCINNMTQNLSVLRTMLHLSQAELASLIGVARSTIVYIENGQRKMTWQTFLSLAFVFIQNKETKELLKFFQIYPDELREIYSDINA